MKIIFVLDDQTVLVSTPEELQLRQVDTGLAALVLPAGKNEKGEDLFRPLVTYPVVLMSPPSPPVVQEVNPVPTPESKPTLVRKKKKA